MSNTKLWWDADHPPRIFAEAILAMESADGKPDKARQRAFFDTHVPKHLQGIVMSHVKNQMALGKSNEQG
jgi:hypothetical protein